VAVAAGVLLGIAVAVGSSYGPARRAVRVDVAAELASRGRRDETLAATSLWRLGLAVTVVAAGVALTRFASYQAGIDQGRARLAPVGFLVAAAGSVYLVSTAVPQLLAVAERRATVRKAPARLALSNLRREPRRSAVMAIALGFAMGVGFITSSFKLSVTEAITDQLNRGFHGVQVSSIDPNNSATNEARLGPAVIEQMAHLPGVASVDYAGYVILGNESGALTGVQAYTDPWEGLQSAAGRFTDAGLARGEVAIGPALARSQGLRPGDELSLATPTGRIRLPIMSVQYDGSFAGRSVLMAYDLFVRVYGEQQPVSVVLTPKRGVSEARLLATVRQARLDGGRLIVEDRAQVIARNAKEVQSQLSTFDAIQRGLLVMSFVAVLSTLLLVGIQREKEFGMLAAVGMTPRELRRMVLTEAGMVAGLGVLATGVGALVMYWCLNTIVPVIIGYKDPFVVDGAAFLGYSAIAIVTALLAALYPSRRAGKVEVLEALRYE
jgi:putative ABC transport system permease protein